MPIKVTYQQKSGRKWSAVFDLGTDIENSLKALDVAWKHAASIIEDRSAERGAS